MQPKTALFVENLIKRYRAPDGTVSTIVDIPAFQLASGASIALRGASGSGKTTFLNLVAGIIAADSGTVRVCDLEMTVRRESLRDHIRARHIGYVFQTFNLLQGLTTLENVELAMRFGPGVNRREARDLLGRVGLGGRLDYRPRQLSVGQQQRVAVARALANRPQLVLADEPTGSLDANLAAGAIELIRTLCAETGAALLLVSHAESVLSAFEQVTDFAAINRAVPTGVLAAGQPGGGVGQ